LLDRRGQAVLSYDGLGRLRRQGKALQARLRLQGCARENRAERLPAGDRLPGGWGGLPGHRRSAGAQPGGDPARLRRPGERQIWAVRGHQRDTLVSCALGRRRARGSGFIQRRGLRLRRDQGGAENWGQVRILRASDAQRGRLLWVVPGHQRGYAGGPVRHLKTAGQGIQPHTAARPTSLPGTRRRRELGAGPHPARLRRPGV